MLEEIQNGQVARKYSYGLNVINETQTLNGQTVTNWYQFDGHSGVRALTGSTGAVVDTYTYDAFGNLIESAGTTPNVYLYEGQQYDRDLGLCYNRARYLDVRTGRFWGMDKYEGDDETPLSLHHYLYAQSDPVNLVDPNRQVFADRNSCNDG